MKKPAHPLVTAAALALALAFAFAGAGAPPVHAAKKVKLLTAEKNGTYHVIGQSIGGVAARQGVEVEVALSGGSGENLMMASLGVADLALVQLDLLSAMSGREDYRKVVLRLEAAVPLYLEEVHIIVRRGAGIAALGDLKGKRVNVGPGASGSFFSATLLLAAVGLDYDGDLTIDHSTTGDALALLAEGKLDAVFLTAGQPVGILAALPKEAGDAIALLALSAEQVKMLHESEMPYFAAEIPGGTYPWQKDAAATIATPCLLLANDEADADTVYRVTKAILENLDGLAKVHSKWREVSLERAQNLRKRNIWPFHPGAARYLDEAAKAKGGG